MKTLKDKEMKVTKNKKRMENKRKAMKYMMTAVVCMCLLITAGCTTNRKENETDVPRSEDGVELFQVNAYPEVMALIEQYYTAYAAGDFATLQTLAEPFSNHELAYMEVLSQYVESYQNMEYYTKSGLETGSYLVNVCLEMKFEGIETAAPGLDFFYVSTREDGTLYIDNTYGQYNMENKENPLNAEIHKLINEHEVQEDVTELVEKIAEKYQTAIEADTNLRTMVNETIPTAVEEWMEGVIQAEANSEALETENPDTEIPSTEAADSGKTENSETEGSSTESSNTENSDVENSDTDSSDTQPENDVISFEEGTVIKLKEATKVREGKGTDTGLVDTLYEGEKVTVVMSYEEGWTKVEWDGKTGYIRSDLLQ